MDLKALYGCGDGSVAAPRAMAKAVARRSRTLPCAIACRSRAIRDEDAVACDVAVRVAGARAVVTNWVRCALVFFFVIMVVAGRGSRGDSGPPSRRPAPGRARRFHRGVRARGRGRAVVARARAADAALSRGISVARGRGSSSPPVRWPGGRPPERDVGLRSRITALADVQPGPAEPRPRAEPSRHGHGMAPARGCDCVLPLAKRDGLHPEPRQHVYHLPKAALLFQTHGYRTFDSPDVRLGRWPCDYELLLADVITLDGNDMRTAWPSVAFFGSSSCPPRRSPSARWGSREARVRGRAPGRGHARSCFVTATPTRRTTS